MIVDIEYDNCDSESGVCPKCESMDFDIGKGEFVDDYYGSLWSIPFTCKSCGFKGRELHRLEFVGFSVDED